MRAWLAVPAAAAVMLAAALLAAPAGAAVGAGTGTNPAEAEAVGQKAYDYGFPLLEFDRARKEMTSVPCPDHKGNSPVNSFSNAKIFADARARTVVAPNTDTLYSISHLDLRKGPVTLSHPRMRKRYYSFELLDPYTNVIDIPGTREDGGAAGSYVIRWSGGPRKTKAKQAKGARVIKSKFRRVWVIGRTLATDKKDQRKAYRLMRKYRLTLPSGKPRKFPGNCNPGQPKTFPTPTEGEPFIAALNAAMAKNPPPKRDDPFLDEISPYGVGPGLSPADAGLSTDTLEAFYAGVAGEAASLPTQSKLKVLSASRSTNGWFLPPANIGDYGTDYDFRAMIASVGLGANTPAEAIYPAGIADSNGALYSGANDYRLTFAPGGSPPSKFFWSLTMYDIDGYLVDNPIDRYSLGPSHPPLAKKPDGSIVIAIQNSEPAEAGVNWLPAPAGGFRLNLRLYGPTRAARTGAWLPPGVVNLGPGGGS